MGIKFSEIKEMVEIVEQQAALSQRFAVLFRTWMGSDEYIEIDGKLEPNPNWNQTQV